MLNKKNYIFEKVYVETPVDTDKDGKYDLVAVYIKRPLETEEGKKVPSIFVANPYMLGCNEDWYIPHDVNQELTVFPEQNIDEKELLYDFNQKPAVEISQGRITQGYAKPEEITEDVELEALADIFEHFIARGYAAVFAGGLGTLDSEGIIKTGSQEEVLAFKSVIDWLNGRARAFTDKENSIETKAWWSTGKVAMSGKSYLGTLSIGVAATGVEGLETIIPEAAISNWYDYYRYNGLNLPAMEWQGDDLDILSKYCLSRARDSADFETIREEFEDSQKYLFENQDRDSGNYNLFWDERNYLRQIDNIKASVFIVHGLNDWNVKTSQCYNLFRELEKRNLPRKILLHQGEHIYMYKMQNSNMLSILERWLDYYLKGIETGIHKEAKVLIQSNLDMNRWFESSSLEDEKNIHTFESIGKGEIKLIDDLAATVYDWEKDNRQEWLDELVLSEEAEYKNRIKYVWDLNDIKNNSDLRGSGEASLSFRASINRPTAVLSAMIVDLGLDYRVTNEQMQDDEGEFYLKLEENPSSFKVITRGWLNAQNRESNWAKKEIKANQYYDYKFSFIPTDYTIKKNHKLGLIIYGIDPEFTQRPKTVTQIRIEQESITLNLPIGSE